MKRVNGKQFTLFYANLLGISMIPQKQRILKLANYTN
jgi:hypothetical protein